MGDVNFTPIYPTTNITTNESFFNSSINFSTNSLTQLNSTLDGTTIQLVDSSLLAYCNMDNRSDLGEGGNIMHCWNGNDGRNMTLVGSPVSAIGKDGLGISTATNKYVNTSINTSSIDLTSTGFTICLDFYAYNNNSAPYSDIMSEGWGMRWWLSKGGYLYANVRNITSADKITSVGQTYYNTWNEVCMSYNNSLNKTRYYLNGVYKSNANTEGIAVSTSNIVLGRGESSGYNLNGTIDNFRMWKKPFSDAEILKLYNLSVIKYNFTDYNLQEGILLNYSSIYINSSNPIIPHNYTICLNNGTDICFPTKSITQTIPLRSIVANFSESVGKRNSGFFGVNHGIRYLSNTSKVDLNGDYSFESPADYEWIRQTLLDEHIDYLTDDMSLGSLFYAIPNPSAEQWIHTYDAEPWAWSNPRFESGATGTGNSSTDAHSGTYSYNLTVYPGSGYGYSTFQYTSSEFELGNFYNFSVWVKSNKSIQLYLQRLDTYANLCGDSNRISTGSGDWELISCSATINEIISSGWRFNIFENQGTTALIDDINFTNNGQDFWLKSSANSSSAYNLGNINTHIDALKWCYENNITMQMNTLSVPIFLQNISSGCNTTGWSYASSSGGCAPINFTTWGRVVKKYVDVVLDGHPERLNAFEIEEFNEADLSSYLSNYSTDDIRKAIGLALLHNATINGVRPYYPNLKITLSSTSSATRGNMIPTIISNFSYNHDPYGFHRYTDTPYSTLDSDMNLLLNNCSTYSADCSRIIIGEWNVASVPIKNYSDGTNGLRDKNIFQSGLIWGLSKYPENVTMVQYQMMEGHPYWVNTSTIYPEWAQRWTQFSQAGLDAGIPLYYWSYNVTKMSAELCPVNSTVKSMTLEYPLIGVSCQLGNYYGMIILNNDTQSYNATINLSLENGTVLYPYNNLTNYETKELYTVNNGKVLLNGDSIMDSYQIGGNNNILYLSSGIPPTITQIQPANLTINTTSQVNFSANLTDDVGLTNSTLNILNTSDNTLIQNVVNYVSGEISVIQSWLVDLADGVYKWWISVFDDEGKENPFLVVNSSTICYQETANISTSCGGLDTGVYSHNFSDNSLIDGIDGSNSGCPGEMPWDAETCFLYVNYTIPNNANNNSIWTTYDAIDGYFNHTLEGCSFTDVLQFRITYNLYGGKTEKCWSGTEWILVSNDDPDGEVSEEKMYWNISTIISGNYTLTVDTTFPKINIIYPLNTTYPYRINYTNYTLIETNPNYCWFSNDSGVTNYSVQTAGLNFSKISQEGLNTWTIFCNDTGNNTNSSRISFTQDTTKPTISFVAPTTNSSNFSQSNIYVNVTTSDLSNHSVISNVGLKLWLRFNNETGENNTYAIDYSGNGNNGTGNNTISTAGKLGSAFSFNGVNSSVKITQNPSSFNITKNITLSSWIYIDKYTCYSRILAKSTISASAPYTIYGLLTDCNQTTNGFGDTKRSVRMELASGNAQHLVRSTTDLVEGQWYLVTGTYDQTNGARLYINGVLDNSTLYKTIVYSPVSLLEVSSLTNGVIDNNLNNLSVGSSRFNDVANNFFNGKIDDTLIYDRALSSNEVMALYNATRLDHNITNLNDGNYNLTVYAQDTSGNVNSTSRWITLDPTPSTIKIIFPQNITYTTNLSNITYTVIEPNLGYCWYSINDGTTNSSLVIEGTNFSMVLLAGAFNTWKLWCNDTVGNLNSSSISFTLDVLPGGGGAVGGGGGGGTWDTTPINLDHLNISWDDFYYNTSSYIYVMPLDKDDKLVNLTNLSISIITPVKYNKGSIQKLVDGRWRQSFTLITSDITEFEANVFATENTKQIEESVMIPISEKKPIKLTAKEWVQNASDYIKDNWLLVAIISFIFFLILIVFSILVLMMRKKQ
jgi:hypothetical protein